MEPLINNWPGNLISSIKISKQLQSNNYTTVSVCSDDSGKAYVLKTLSGLEYEIYFAKELAVAAVVTAPHANLVRLVDASAFVNAFETRKNKYNLLYEYAPNGDLFDYIKNHYSPRRPPKQQWVARMMRGIIAGLMELHKHGIIHRDLKLENVVLDEDFNPKICDFAFCEWDTLRRQNSADLTILQKERKHLLGTPGYMAPESIKQYRAGVGSDVFSLGVLLYELTTAQSPFGNFGTADVDVKAIVDPLELTFPRKCPPELVSLIQSMLSHQINSRPAISDVLAFFEPVES